MGAKIVDKLNIVIPMAGIGQRFKDAGYTTQKAFIEIAGKPMIQHALDAFPNSVARHLIITKNAFDEAQIDFLENTLNCNLIYIKPHKLGPAYSIYSATADLPLDESIFIAYCDVYWTWDFGVIVENLNHEGIVFTHRKFHPHLVRNNFSAFCRPKEDNPDFMVEIREKLSFTDNWMEEPLSVGVFFFRSGQTMTEVIKQLVEKNQRTANEFFPSVAFNQLISDGRSVKMQDVDFFIHWGQPEQLDDFMRWKNIHNHSRKKNNARHLGKNVVCMGGLGSRMKGTSDTPKALMDVSGQPMYAYVASQFPSHDVEVITSQEIATLLLEKDLPPPALILPTQTANQLETLRESAKYLLQQKQFFVSSCDAYGEFDDRDFTDFLEREKPDAVIFTFKPSLMQSKLAENHTHVSVSGNLVLDIHIKLKTSSEDIGLSGYFWVQDGNIFNNMDDINDGNYELSIDHAFKAFIKQGYKVLHYLVDQNVHLGTPEEFLEYQFWINHFNKLEFGK
jgi:NDP-sugar pyrophosphorylase family protein